MKKCDDGTTGSVVVPDFVLRGGRSSHSQRRRAEGFRGLHRKTRHTPLENSVGSGQIKGSALTDCNAHNTAHSTAQKTPRAPICSLRSVVSDSREQEGCDERTEAGGASSSKSQAELCCVGLRVPHTSQNRQAQVPTPPNVTTTCEDAR